jgi:hypothetical protein
MRTQKGIQSPTADKVISGPTGARPLACQVAEQRLKERQEARQNEDLLVAVLVGIDPHAVTLKSALNGTARSRSTNRIRASRRRIGDDVAPCR